MKRFLVCTAGAAFLSLFQPGASFSTCYNAPPGQNVQWATSQIAIGSLENQNLFFYCDSLAEPLAMPRAVDTATIRLRAGITFTESPVVCQPENGTTIAIMSGYNEFFTGQAGMSFSSTLAGHLAIENCDVSITRDYDLFVEPDSSGYLVIDGDVEVISGSLTADSLIIR